MHIPSRSIAVVLSLMLFGCATLHNGRYQDVEVATDPPGATVQVHCGREQPTAMTPTTVRLSRRAELCSILLTRQGFRSQTVVFNSRPSRWAWANFGPPIVGSVSGMTRHSDAAFTDFLLGAAIGGAGFGIDAMTGAMWEREPARVERALVPE